MKEWCKLIASCLIFTLAIVSFTCRNVYTADNNQEINKIYEDSEISAKLFDYYLDFKDSVVQIFSVKQDNKYLGTGFFVNNEKIIATNYHVVSNSSQIYILFNDDEFAYKAKVISVDVKNDIALLYVIDDIYDYKPISLSLDFAEGDIAFTSGFDTDYNIKVGYITDIEYEYKKNKYIRINNSVNQGNSGGPVLNMDKEVIGMVTFGNSSTTSLIPSYKIQNMINKIEY